MFYPPEEFNAQMEEYLARGMSYAQAYTKVCENERKDEEDYARWLDEQQSWQDIGCEFDDPIV